MKVNGDLRFRTLGSGELQNAIIERIAGGVSGDFTGVSVVAGRIAFNTDTQSYWYYAAGAINDWVEFGAGVDLTNVINSGGYMNGDGTFDASVFSSFTNVAGSPLTTNLVEVLSQLDAAIAAAAGVDTLKELTDVDVDGETTNGPAAPAYAGGQIIFYDAGNSRWTSNDTSSIATGDFLIWDGSEWAPTTQSSVLSLGELNDVVDTVTSGASDGQVLSFDGDAGVGNEWRAHFVNFIRTQNGSTNIDLSGGSLNPDGESSTILFNIGIGSPLVETNVATFSTTTISLQSRGTVDIDAAAQGNVTIDGGPGNAATGGTVTVTGGYGNDNNGGAVTVSGGSTDNNSYLGGNLTLSGGANPATSASQIVIEGVQGYGDAGDITITAANHYGAGRDGGSVIITAGDGTGGGAGTAYGFVGDIRLYAGAATTSGAGGNILLQAGADGDAYGGFVQIQQEGTGSSTQGEVRIYANNNTNSIGLTVPGTLSDVTYTLPVSPVDTYLLQTNGSGTLSWVDPATIGGNSFATWSNDGGTGDASITADTTSDTVTLISGSTAAGGIDIAFSSTGGENLTFSLTNSGLSGTAAVVGTDTIWFNDIGTGINSRTFQQVIDDLDIVSGVSGTGLLVRVNAGSPVPQYVSRTIVASTTDDELGIVVNNGNAVAANPEVGLDVVGLTTIGGTPASDDELVIYDTDGTVNRKVSVAALTGGIVGAGLNLGDLENVTLMDPVTAGDILYVTDGSPEMWSNAQPGPTTGVQAYDVSLTSIAGLSLTTNDFIYVSSGSPETFATIASGTTGRALLGDETVADAITTLGLDSGGASDIWVDEAGDTMTGDLIMAGAGAGSPALGARIQLTDGTSTLPSLTFAGDLDTGLYRPSDNALVLGTGGAGRITINSAGTVTIESSVLRVQDGTAGAPSFTFESDTGKGMYNQGNSNLGFATSGAERLRIYGATGGPGSPVSAEAGAISVEATMQYENLIPDPSAAGFTTPVDDYLPNAKWVEQYFLQLSGGTLTGDIVLSGAGTDINMDGGKVINLADPTDPLDAANKQYVDSLTAGLIWIDPVYFVDLLKDNVEGDVTRDFDVPASSDAIVSDVETSDMLIANTSGNWTARGTGNGSPITVTTTFANVGDVMRLDDDADNANAAPSWDNLGNIADITKFPSEHSAGAGASSSRWVTRVATNAVVDGTFVNMFGSDFPDGKDGVVVKLIDADPFSRITLGSGSPSQQENSPQYYDAWWGKDLDFSTAQVTKVVAGPGSGLTTGDYFTLVAGVGNFAHGSEGIGGSPAPGPMQTRFYMWFNVDAGGGDPTPFGADAANASLGIEVTVSSGDSAQAVATAIETAIDNYRPCTVGNNPLLWTVEIQGSPAVDVIITDQHGGRSEDAVDVNTGFTITTETAGTEPQPVDSYAFFVNNPVSANFGRQFTFTAETATGSPAGTGQWREFGATASVVDGIGLSFSGNVLNVNLGAGIFEQPGDEVGIELYDTSAGALILTTDGTTRATGAATKLHLLLDAAGGLDQGTAGLRIAAAGVTNAMLQNGSGITFTGDAGTPQAIALGDDITFRGDGSTGITVTAAAAAGSPTLSSTMTFALSGVPTSALAVDSWDITDGTSTESVTLGETLTVGGGIISTTGAGSPSAGGLVKIRRIEDADSDTYVQVSTGVADDSDTVTIEAAGAANGTFSAAGISLSSATIDIDATTTTVTIDSTTTTDIAATTALTLTGGADATLSATTLDALVEAVAGSVELKASTAVEVLDNVDLRLHDADNSAYVGHRSAAVVGTSVTYEWPEAPAGDGYVLTADSSGAGSPNTSVMTWKTTGEVGRTRLEDLDDVTITGGAGSPSTYPEGDVIVAKGGSPNVFENKRIQYIYDSTLTSTFGSPLGSPQSTAKKVHTINHNIGQKFVNVTVYNTSDSQIIPQSVVLNSANQLTVTLNDHLDVTVVIMGVPGVVAADGS